MVFQYRPSEISQKLNFKNKKRLYIQLNHAVSLYHEKGSVRARRSEILSSGRHTCGRRGRGHRSRTSGMVGICCRAPLRKPTTCMLL